MLQPRARPAAPPVAAVSPREPEPHHWPRLALSLAVALMGCVNVASALLSRPPERLLALKHLVPNVVLDTSRTFALLAGALLLVTAWGLRRGKRRGYALALLLCAISAPVHLLKALDVEEASLAIGLMLALALNADSFRVRSRALTAAVLRSGAVWSAAAALAYVLAGSWILSASFGVEPSVGRAFADAAHRMFGIGEAVVLIPERLTPAAHHVVAWYLRSLPLLALLWVTGTALALLAPATHRRRHRTEAGRVRALAALHGASSVSWFAHQDSEADFFFSRNQRAVIAYRFVSDVALVLGDPIGPPEDREALLRDFAAWCAAGDWSFAIYQATPEWLPVYRSLGWRALPIGVEPVLDPGTFTLEGGARGDVRRAARKAAAAGITVRHFRPDETPFDAAPVPPGLIDELRSVSSQWLQAHPGHEMTFCMGRFDPAALPFTWTAVAWNEAIRRVEGFVTWTPFPARRGWALDLMRRRSDAAPGTMELLVTDSVAHAARAGDAVMSLSLSALASAPAEATASSADAPAPERPFPLAEPERAREFLVRRLGRFYDFAGLFQWKRKFAPRYEERYLIVPSSMHLPGVALALARAQSPGGLSQWLRRPAPAGARA